MYRSTSRGGFLPAMVWLGLAVLSCGDSAIEPQVPPVKTYEVRGLVRQVEARKDSRTQISIHHEAIPDFVGIRGEVEGMQPMTMPFVVDESVEFEGVEQGTKILFELTVDWSAPEPGRITRIEILPEGTILDFDASG